ncbi:MAG: PEP-CTERM sorting domain-containing protein, partial [Bryobacteraceae bacterium]
GLTNTGAVYVEYGGTLTTDGTFTNSGSGSYFEVGIYGAANATVNALSLAGVVRIDQGSTLNITGGGSGVTDVASNTTLRQDGTFEVSGSANALANLATVEGTLELGDQQTTTIASLTNSGIVDVGDCGSGSGCSGTTLHTTGDVTNSGNLYVENGGTLTTDGTFTNAASGHFEVGAFGAAASTIHALNNSGSVQVDASSTLSASNFTNNPGATVTLEAASGGHPGGVLDPLTYTSGGVTTVGAGSTLDVGSGTPGVTGYDQTSDGTLQEEIFGLPSANCTGSAGDCGIINVTGDVTLSGTLDPILENGFDPMNGDSFLFMTFTGALNGAFSSIADQIFGNNTQQWNVTYGNGFVELTANAYTPAPPSAVPEPRSILLFGLGLIALGVGTRLRKRNRRSI